MKPTFILFKKDGKSVFLFPSHQYFFFPLTSNPMGRTGVVGRGLLGRFGPNHAADPIVTR